MRITKQQLKQIIQEEIQAELDEGWVPDWWKEFWSSRDIVSTAAAAPAKRLSRVDRAMGFVACEGARADYMCKRKCPSHEHEKVWHRKLAARLCKESS